MVEHAAWIRSYKAKGPHQCNCRGHGSLTKHVLCKCLTQMRLFISLHFIIYLFHYYLFHYMKYKIRWFRKRLEGKKRYGNQSIYNTIALLTILLGSGCLKESNEDWVRGVWLGCVILLLQKQSMKQKHSIAFSSCFCGLLLLIFFIRYLHGFTRHGNGTTELLYHIPPVTYVIALVTLPKYPNSNKQCLQSWISWELLGIQRK